MRLHGQFSTFVHFQTFKYVQIFVQFIWKCLQRHVFWKTSGCMSRLAGWFSLHYGGKHPGLGHVKLLPCHVERVAGVHFLPKSSSLEQNYCLKCSRQWQNWDVTKIQILVCSWIQLGVIVLTCCIISSSTSSLYIAIGELYCLLASFCFPTWDQHPMMTFLKI